MSSAGLLRYVEVPAHVERGTEPKGTLLLLHAFPLNAHMWEPQLGLADFGWRVIAPHFRGFGGSRIDPLQVSMDDYVSDVIDLLDALHIESAVVAGLSMGGYAAFALFRRAPRYVRALILADTRPQGDTKQARQQRESMLSLVHDKGPSAVADAMMPSLLSERTRRDCPAVATRVRALVEENSCDALAGAIHALMTRGDSTMLLPSIDVPTLVVAGEDDTVTPPAIADDMHHHIARSAFLSIPAAGHLSNLEQPAQFNAAVAGFLASRV